jgi:hypothetical protein
MSEEEEPVKECWDNRPVIFLSYLIFAIMFFSLKKKDSSGRRYLKMRKHISQKELFSDSFDCWEKSRFLTYSWI